MLSSKLKYKVKVNGQEVELARGRLIESLRDYGLAIPAVCYHPDIVESGGRCRVCCCSVNGRIVPTCDIEVREGMNIVTNTPELERLRDSALELVPHDDVTAVHVENAQQLTISDEQKKTEVDNIPLRKKSKYVLRRPELCTHCGLCVSMCQQVQGVSAIADVRLPSGEGSIVEAFHNANLAESECVACGQCINVCPTGALEEASEIDLVEAALNDPESIKVVQFAPAVRLALAEEFGYAPGERRLTDEMVEACRILANRKNIHVFDTNFAADLTIVEEGYELLERLRRTLTGQKKFGGDHMNVQLPMITSCSPGWVLFCEKNYHDLLPNLSSCKSPQQMSGALTKQYWGPAILEKDFKETGRKRKIVSIAIMPCVAKKAEKERPEFATNGEWDVDYVLTTREFARMCREKGVDPTRLRGEQFDLPYGIGSGAGLIFGATGGVMEAAIRTAYEVVTGKEVPFRRLAITEVRGMQGVKEASVKMEGCLEDWKFLEGAELKVAVAHGVANARKLMDRVRAAHEQGLAPEWHFIEVMGCPGGCLGGGGQPKPTSWDIKMKRAQLIYEGEEALPIRKSHENPSVRELYRTFLKEPLGHNSHRILHTAYTPRETEVCSLIASPEAKDIRQKILYKYPPNTRHGLTNILVDIVDHFGYISDPAVAAIATHVGTTPVAIDSIISHYHFLPRSKPTSQSTLWLCDCLSCRSKGSREIKHHIRERERLRHEACMKEQGAGAVCEPPMEVHMVQWLGFCMNGPPGAMIQRAGDPQLHAIYDLKVGDPRLESNASVDAIEAPQEGIRFRQLPISRFPCLLPTPADPKTGKPGDPSLSPCLHRPSILENIHLDKKDVEWRLSNEGRCPVSNKINQMSPDDIIEQIKISGLRGCGGAGFPTHLKWRAVRDVDPAVERYVVVNADEGLPSTFKDYGILADPSRRMRMLIGMCACARVVRATKCVMYLRYEYKNLKKPIEMAFQKYATELNPLVSAVEKIKFEVILGAGPYVCGEETALFESVEGQKPQARCHREKYATEKGLHGAPTCVNNVETLAWVPSILYYGGQAFANCGINGPKNHGVKLFSVSGQVAQPTLAEFPMGTTLREIIKECAPEIPITCGEGGGGGGGDLCGDLAAVEVGGVVEPLLMGDRLIKALDSPLTLTGAPDTLPGGGSVVLFRRSHGFNAATFYQAKAKFAHVESCNLCAPCREGTKLFREQIVRMITNPGSIWDKEKLEFGKLYSAMEQLSNCGHGKACGKMAKTVFEDQLGPLDKSQILRKQKLWHHPERKSTASYADKSTYQGDDQKPIVEK